MAKTTATSKVKPYSPTFEGEADNKSGLVKDGFVSTRSVGSHDKRVKPAVKAKDLSGSLKEVFGPSGASKWEQGGDARKNPSVRSFHGSKPNRVK
jgi:hypothetical protein